MYANCLYCATHLGANDAIEQFPIGQRLAFDERKGRLWVVCRACERWNLSPLEERWEAVEECERLFRHARKRVASDNIGLARLDGPVELIRIGNPLRPEFAAWRYGDQFGRRRRRTITRGAGIAVAAAATAVGALSLGAVALGGIGVYEGMIRWSRRAKDQRLVALIPGPDEQIFTVLGEHLSRTQLRTEFESKEGWTLNLAHVRGTYALRDFHALHATSMIMPAINGTGGTQHNVDRAITRLEGFDDPVRYMRSAAAESVHHTRPGPAGGLTGLPADIRLAIEMAVNEENERCVLSGELWLLEMAWRQAEKIASIADGLLVPEHLQRQLDDLKERGRGVVQANRAEPPRPNDDRHGGQR